MAKEKTEKKVPRKTIMSLVGDLFTKNPNIETQAVIVAVQKAFPKSKINKAHVGWYRGHFRAKGIDIPKRRGAGGGKKKKAADKKKTSKAKKK